MRKTLSSRLLSILTVLVIIMSAVPASFTAVYAEDGGYTGCGDITVEYSYVSNESDDSAIVVNNGDTVRYNDQWFAGSSYELSRQLATLSSIAAITSAGYHEDPDEKDHTSDSRFIEAFLTSIGFENVKANEEYNAENMPLGAGVCIGSKKVTFDGTEYTLLAVIPRSANYKQEWAGNFDVRAAEAYHYGFKSARDEILRFLKYYIDRYNIEGVLKVWIAGHSRGAALANMTAAFLASGTDYLGDDIIITPGNVFCYTFATPRTVITNKDIEKSDFLSVEGSRSGVYEGMDTYQDAYAYNGTPGTVDPGSVNFSGIHNCAPDYDIITLLPPKGWNYGYFGTVFPITDGNEGTKEKMLGFLKDVSGFTYDRFTAEEDLENADNDNFTWFTFDPDSLTIVKDESCTYPISQSSFYADRIIGLVSNASAPDDYVGIGAREALMAMAGIYGMAIYPFADGFMSDTEPLLKGGLLAFLDYASDNISSTAGIDKNAAMAVVFEKLLTLMTGNNAAETGRTVDDVINVLAKYLVDHGKGESGSDNNYTVSFDSKTAETLYSALSSLISGSSIDEKILWENVIASCAGEPQTRQFLYTLLTSYISDESIKAMINSLLAPAEGQIDFGTKSDIAFVELILSYIMSDGETLASAADRYLTVCVRNGMDAALASGRYDAGTEFYNDLKGYGDTLIAKVNLMKELILDGLFYSSESDFSVEGCIRNAATFIGNVPKLAVAHYNETYVAWMKAQDPAYAPGAGHAMTHSDYQAPECGKDGKKEYWYCSKCGKYFTDEKGLTGISADELAIAALEHDYGAWTVIDPASPGAPGKEQRVCSHNSGHTETREFSYMADASGVIRWGRDETAGISFVIERSTDNDKAFGLFTGLELDGAPLEAVYYTAEPGSVKIAVAPAFLKTLSNGGHTLTAVFEDGSAEVRIRILENSDNPITGINDRLALLMILTAVAVLMIAIIRRRKTAR